MTENVGMPLTGGNGGEFGVVSGGTPRSTSALEPLRGLVATEGMLTRQALRRFVVHRAELDRSIAEAVLDLRRRQATAATPPAAVARELEGRRRRSDGS